MKNSFPALVLLCLLSCKKAEQTAPLKIESTTVTQLKLDTVKSIPLTIMVDQNSPGRIIPKTFAGFSYEVEILTKNPEFLNEQNQILINMFNNLGSGVLRIGGHSSDLIPWTGTKRSLSNKGINSLITTDIDKLSKFVNVTDWPVVFGLNLGANDPMSAADEAKYISSSLKNNLLAVQMGNEPDFYMYDNLRTSAYGYADFWREWKSYYTAINSITPRLLYAGPDVDYNTGWIEALGNNARGALKFIDQHYYAYPQGPKPGVPELLQKDQGLDKYFKTLRDISKRVNLPFFISECNSITYGGKAGVSNAFASALWGLDFMWQAASNNSEGVNFHSGPDIIYTPIAIDNNVLTARPLYYGMLAFNYGAKEGKIIPVTLNDNSHNINAYGCLKTDGKTYITLINKDDSKTFAVELKLTSKADLISVARLEAPKLTSLTGIMFANSSVASNGKFSTNITEKLRINSSNNPKITIQPASAIVLEITN